MTAVARYSWLSTLAALVLLAGCKTQVLPDPNDPPVGQTISGEILVRNIEQLVNGLDTRMRQGEINQRQHDDLLAKMIHRMIKGVDPSSIPPKQAWQFGDAYRLSGDWQTAKSLYETAVRVADTTGRTVNDTLRLARVQAHLGDVTTAIKTCRSTFKVGPQDKGPILMAVLYEVEPEAQGKGHDYELAKLVEDAISQHEQTLVDQDKEAGQSFLRARPAHVHNAWIRVAQLYQASGHLDEARRAIQKEEEARQKTGLF